MVTYMDDGTLIVCRPAASYGRGWQAYVTTLLNRVHATYWIMILLASTLGAQTYDLLLKNGHVIDPANQIDGVRDIGITGNKIARVATAIPAREGRKTI